jgi:hypothetical protein
LPAVELFKIPVNSRSAGAVPYKGGKSKLKIIIVARGSSCKIKVGEKVWKQEARKKIDYAACAAVGVFNSITLSRSPLTSS